MEKNKSHNKVKLYTKLGVELEIKVASWERTLRKTNARYCLILFGAAPAFSHKNFQ